MLCPYCNKMYSDNSNCCCPVSQEEETFAFAEQLFQYDNPASRCLCCVQPATKDSFFCKDCLSKSSDLSS